MQYHRRRLAHQATATVLRAGFDRGPVSSSIDCLSFVRWFVFCLRIKCHSVSHFSTPICLPVPNHDSRTKDTICWPRGSIPTHERTKDTPCHKIKPAGQHDGVVVGGVMMMMLLLLSNRKLILSLRSFSLPLNSKECLRLHSEI